MPTYEYACEACGEHTEVQARLGAIDVFISNAAIAQVVQDVGDIDRKSVV